MLKHAVKLAAQQPCPYLSHSPSPSPSLWRPDPQLCHASCHAHLACTLLCGAMHIHGAKKVQPIRMGQVWLAPDTTRQRRRPKAWACDWQLSGVRRRWGETTVIDCNGRLSVRLRVYRTIVMWAYVRHKSVAVVAGKRGSVTSVFAKVPLQA